MRGTTSTSAVRCIRSRAETVPHMPPKTNPNRHVHKVKLTDFKAKKADEGAIEIEADDGKIFRVDPPELWDDDVAELQSAGDTVGLAHALIGDEYPDYIAAGGNAMLLMSIIAEVHGVDVGESKASSGS